MTTLNHIQFSSGSSTEYVYTTDGRKLRTVHTTAVPYVRVAMGQTMELDSSMVLSRNVVDYWDGGVIVRNDTLSALLFDGGYAKIKAADDSCSLAWHYYVKDHLGSIRVVQGEDGTPEQVSHYYPYGNTLGPHNGNDINPTLQQYKFNGKELDPVHGLGLYDYGARMYDPLVGRWTSVDPMAEKYYHISPYAMCGGNPFKYIDLSGDSLSLTGSESALALTVKIMNQYANSKYELSKGQIVYTHKADTQNGYDKVFNDIIDDKQNTQVNVVEGAQDVIIGNADKRKIDIKDIFNIGNREIVNSGSALGHELYEQYQIQVKGALLNIAHLRASVKEAAMTESGYNIPFNERVIAGDSIIIKGVNPLTNNVKTIVLDIKYGNITK